MNNLYYRLNGYEVRRKRLLKKAPEGALKDFLSVPFPAPDRLLSDCKILSVDFETTGLNAQQDKLLSVGFVELVNNQIPLASCFHQVINTGSDLVASNVQIHQITDAQKCQGESLAHVVEQLLQALAGKVMLVHFACIEKQFLAQACRELYGLAPVFPVIDSLTLIKNRLDRRNIPYDASLLRLSNLRERYNLPQHYAHNALNDAIATAELLLVETASSTYTKQKLASFLL
jgi:DNA polymerase-3 subunit epsilon